MYKHIASLILVLFSAGCIVVETKPANIPARPTSPANSMPDGALLQEQEAASTLTPTPLPKNTVLVSRTSYPGGCGIDEITSCMYGYDTYNFVLSRLGLSRLFYTGRQKT